MPQLPFANLLVGTCHNTVGHQVKPTYNIRIKLEMMLLRSFLKDHAAVGDMITVKLVVELF